MNRYTGKTIGALVAAVLACSVTQCNKHDHQHHQTLESSHMAKGSLFDLELSFTDAKNQPVTLRSLAGNPVIMSMVYTRCQSICPTMAGNMLSIQQKLNEKDRARTTFVLVSFDSADSPEDLAAFARKMRLDDRWVMLRGDADSVRQLGAALGFQYRKNPDGGFSHSATTYVLDQKGRVAFKRDGTTAAAGEFRTEIEKL